MNLISKNWVIALLTRVVVIIIAVKALALGLLWFLPNEGVNFAREISVQPAYHRYVLSNMLKTSKPVASKKTASATMNINDLILKGLYGNEKSGFVIVALKSKADRTEVIGVGEAFNGYTLISIHPDHAVFRYRGANYKVVIETAGALPPDALTPSQAPEVGPDSGEPTAVTRKEITSYTENIDKIWKDIGIQEVKSGGKIKGFKVVRIRPGTPFAELGLQKGDIIIRANNKSLDSYAAAMDIYKQINTLKALELVVLRNNQEKELIYEIQ